MPDDVFDNIVYSKNVIEFVTVANEYCGFIESQGRFSRLDFVDKLHKILPLVYLKAAVLPDFDDEDIESPEKFLTEVDYNFLLNKTSGKMAQFDGYQEVFDERMQFSESAIEANISEDVCDIYQDLKDFIMAYRIGNDEIMQNAIWECKNNFKEYWGQKLTNSLRALHALRYGDEDLNEEEEVSKSEAKPIKKDNWVNKHFNNFFEEEEREDNDV